MQIDTGESKCKIVYIKLRLKCFKGEHFAAKTNNSKTLQSCFEKGFTTFKEYPKNLRIHQHALKNRLD